MTRIEALKVVAARIEADLRGIAFQAVEAGADMATVEALLGHYMAHVEPQIDDLFRELKEFFGDAPMSPDEADVTFRAG